MTKRSKAIQNFNIEYHVQYVDNKKSLEGRGDFFFSILPRANRDTQERYAFAECTPIIHLANNIFAECH